MAGLKGKTGSIGKYTVLDGYITAGGGTYKLQQGLPYRRVFILRLFRWRHQPATFNAINYSICRMVGITLSSVENNMIDNSSRYIPGKFKYRFAR
jgi:hypothetical protein